MKSSSAQLAVDATSVLLIIGPGAAWPAADAELGGAASAAARRKRRQTCYELELARRCWLMVAALESQGVWVRPEVAHLLPERE